MPEWRFLADEAFRIAAMNGTVLDGMAVRKVFAAGTVALAAGDKPRTLQFTISTADVDRMGDTVAVEGWQLENYRSNPVVLWQHDSRTLPIGRSTRVWIEGGKLKAIAEFMPADLNEHADKVYRMLKGGWLRATSVGFRPLEYEFTKDPGRKYGIDFKKSELLEFSVVNVPANPSALIEPGLTTGSGKTSPVALQAQILELETLR